MSLYSQWRKDADRRKLANIVVGQACPSCLLLLPTSDQVNKSGFCACGELVDIRQVAWALFRESPPSTWQSYDSPQQVVELAGE